MKIHREREDTTSLLVVLEDDAGQGEREGGGEGVRTMRDFNDACACFGHS